MPGASYRYVDILCDESRCGLFVEWAGHWFRIECDEDDTGHLECAAIW